jgi:rRNA maturation endonuclease Nob1
MGMYLCYECGCDFPEEDVTKEVNECIECGSSDIAYDMEPDMVDILEYQGYFLRGE